MMVVQATAMAATRVVRLRQIVVADMALAVLQLIPVALALGMHAQAHALVIVLAMIR